VESVFAERAGIRGLKMVYEPKYLRFFQARFEPLA
jgi:tyrosine phenol-lyase